MDRAPSSGRRSKERVGFMRLESLRLGLSGHWAAKERRAGWLYPPGQKQDDQDDDNEAGSTAQKVIAGTEAVATTAEQQQDEQDNEDIHGCLSGGLLACRLMTCRI